MISSPYMDLGKRRSRFSDFDIQEALFWTLKPGQCENTARRVFRILLASCSGDGSLHQMHSPGFDRGDDRDARHQTQIFHRSARDRRDE